MVTKKIKNKNMENKSIKSKNMKNKNMENKSIKSKNMDNKKNVKKEENLDTLDKNKNFEFFVYFLKGFSGILVGYTILFKGI